MRCEAKARVPRFVEGFTTKVNYYMQLADFFIGKPGPGSVSEALAMQLPVIVECNAWTLPQERYNAEWIIEKEVGVVLKNFKSNRSRGSAAHRTSDAGALSRESRALHNQAVFEIPDMLQNILESSRPLPRIPRPHLIADRCYLSPKRATTRSLETQQGIDTLYSSVTNSPHLGGASQ